MHYKNRGRIYSLIVTTYSEAGRIIGIMLEADGDGRDLIASIARNAKRDYLRFDAEIFGTLNGTGRPFVGVADDIIERWQFFEKTGIVFPERAFPLLSSLLTHLCYAEEDASFIWEQIAEKIVPYLPNFS
jgi:hypothetical protein